MHDLNRGVQPGEWTGRGSGGLQTWLGIEIVNDFEAVAIWRRCMAGSKGWRFGHGAEVTAQQ